MKYILGLLLVVLLAACSQQAPIATLDSQASQWKFLGNKLNTTSAGDPSLALRANDRPVVAFYELRGSNNTPYVVVKEWTGSAWTALGNVGQIISSQYNIATRAKNAPGAPYYDPIALTYAKNGGATSGDTYVKLRIGNAWLELPGPLDVKPANNTNNPSVVLDKLGFPIVAWFEFDPTTGYTIYTKRWLGTKWVQLGGALTPDTFPRAGLDLSIDNAGNPVLAFSAYDPVSTVFKVYVKRWNGFNWVQQGGVLGSDQATNPSVAIASNGQSVVTWTENLNTYARRWNGSSWVSLGTTVNSSASFYSSVVIDNSNQPVVVFDDNGNVNVKRWTGTQWEITGNALGFNSGERLGIVINSQNKAIITWLENGATTSDVYVRQQK